MKTKIKEWLGRGRADGASLTAAVIAAVLLLNACLYTAVNVFSLVIPPKGLYDLSVSDAADGLFSEAQSAGKSVQIIFCSAEEEVRANGHGSLVLDTAKELAARHPDFLSLSFINILTQRDEEGRRVDVDAFRHNPDGTENAVYKTSVIFRSGDGAFRVITDLATSDGYSDFYVLDSANSPVAYNGEEVLVAMSMWVLRDEHPSAYFTVRHSEIADVSLRNALACAGYYVGQIDLSVSEVPADADLVLISAPQNDFEAAAEGSGIRTEIERLRDYLDAGGGVFVCLSPYLKKNLVHLEGLLAEYGIRFATYTDGEGKTYKEIVREAENAITTDGFTLVGNYADPDGEIAKRAASFGGVLLRETPHLILDGAAVPVLLSSATAHPEAAGERVGDAGRLVLAAASETAGGGHLFVLPSVYATATDAMLAKGYSNRALFYAVCETLFGSDRVAYGTNAVLISNTDVLENLTMGGARRLTVLLMAIPAVIALGGVIVLRRRKNR